MKCSEMIKHYEQRLLNHLRSEHKPEGILSDVRASMGELAYVKGNPLTKTEIMLKIDVFYYGGAPAGFILPLALPAVLQISLPCYLLGLTDSYGGYLKSTIINPIRNPWMLATMGVGISFLGIWNYNINTPPLVALFPLFISGDLVLIFYSAVGGVNYFGIVRVRCSNVAYGTFLHSFVSDLITISTLRYSVPIANINQFVNPLIFGYQTLFGKITTNTVDPRMYITPKDFQQQVCDIPIHLPIDKALMLGFQIEFNCVNSTMILFVEKVEPLTYKR